MNSLEKLVNYVRIAPHGFIPTGIAISLAADRLFNLGLYDNLSPALQTMDNLILGICIGASPQHSIGGIKKYIKFKHFIEDNGINKEHIEKNLRWYCERQAYKAAAYSCEVGEEFNQINKNFKDSKYFTWVPEI